ncbi:HAMP domain-containing sensor histidine kinase [Nonomuraea sp. NPDC049421]|uniref:sensor histidine kinase n=1 Tax=Nonomuraea sp. NPDC049421 TaxID=3155275 RepID=UPI0034291956
MIVRPGRSIRARLALFASAAMTLLCVAAAALLLWATRSTIVDIRTREVISTALRVVYLIKDHNLPRVTSIDLDGLQVVDASGQVVSSTPNLAGSPRLIRTVPEGDEATRIGTVCDRPEFAGDCQIVVSFRVYEPEGDWVVYAFGPLPPWYVSPAAIMFLLLFTVVLVALTWFGVSRVVARTLDPVQVITERLAAITGGDGSLRLPVPDSADEIRRLAETANQTLERLESALEQQRRFASDASHDLRSPITAMRTELEMAMLAPEETDWRETGTKLLAGLDRLQNIVTDLLMLARLDAGEPGTLEPVGLGELVAGETATPRSKQVVTSLEPGVVVTGDRHRLARLLTNLLDNAERHAERTITVTVRAQGPQAVLEVLDDGAGIAPEHRERVFQRFMRLDAARNRDAGGTGLGLPIAREIAGTHHGTLRIEDSETGARFVLRLPRVGG